MKPSQYNTAIQKNEAFTVGNMTLFTKEVPRTEDTPKKSWDQDAMTLDDTIKVLKHRIWAPYLYSLAITAVENFQISQKMCQVILGDTKTLKPSKKDLDKECILVITPLNLDKEKPEVQARFNQYPMITRANLENPEFIKSADIQIEEKSIFNEPAAVFKFEATVNETKQIFQAQFLWTALTLD